jgi:ADP-ribosylglycohydrolase
MNDASITHGHLTAQHASGILAVIIALCLQGEELLAAVEKALDVFGTEDIVPICKNAVDLSKQKPSADALASIGKGWVAEEALAMSLYCALQCTSNGLSSQDALRLAVNHGGDSDSVGSITGNLIGISMGIDAIPEALLSTGTEVKSLLQILKTYGEELITLPSRTLSSVT